MPLKWKLKIGEDDKFCYVYFTTIKNKGFILIVGIMYVVHMDFPGGSDSKDSACNGGDPRFDPWVRKNPWRREWLPTPVFLPR